MSGPSPAGPIPPNLASLEAEAIHILREACAEARAPVLLFSGGKDSTVLAALAKAAFFPSAPPMPLLHIDSTFEFAETLTFRDRLAREWGFDLLVRRNEQGYAASVSPFTHGSGAYTELMRTLPLKAALDELGADIVFGGARRDEERSRAKERVVSLRSKGHAWDPRAQRPELWRLYNARLSRGDSARVFPLSNWTEADVWTYIHLRRLPIAPLYFATPRLTVIHGGALLVAVDDRLPQTLMETASERWVRFRTVGCWPVTAAMESRARTMSEVLAETFLADRSERQGRLIDTDEGGSLEVKKRQGYF